MTPPTAPTASAIDREATQARTLVTLRIAQVPAQAAVAGVVAVVALMVNELLHNDQLAGTGSAAMTFGAGFVAVPLSAFMRRRGRRPGLTRAFALGAIGAVVAALGGQVGWYPLFIVGMFAFGSGQAAGLQGRFVAADLAAPDERSRAIGSVVWVGTLGAAFGPLLTPWERHVAGRLGLQPLIGPFLFAAAFFSISAIVVATRLRPDPLTTAGLLDPSARRVRPWHQVRSAAVVISTRPMAKLGLVAMVVSQTAMVAVMTMTPPHMKDHHHSDLSAYVIALHIVGMYGFAPFVGRVVERIGRRRSIMVGAVVLGTGTTLSFAGGYHPVTIFVGLFLLGAGWSFGLIAGSALLSESVPAEQRVEVQGAGDLTMSVLGGLAAFSSGFVKASLGYGSLGFAATVAAAALVVFASARRHAVIAAS